MDTCHNAQIATQFCLPIRPFLLGARLRGGPGELASAPQWIPGSGHVTYTELTVDFEVHRNWAMGATPGHRHAKQVLALQERTHVLHEAIEILQPPLASVTLVEGNFQWVCASLVPLHGFCSRGRIEWPVCACQLDIRQHIARAAAATTLTGAVEALLEDPRGRPPGFFLVGYLTCHPGGAALARPYETVRVPRLWVVGVVRPR